MHIAEGFLPLEWALAWYAIAMPIIVYGAYKVKKLLEEKPEMKSLIAVAGGFIFVLSALKIPSVTGSCSHPTGTGIAVVLFGPAITAFLSTIVLLYQALLLAHGGITTLGANVTSMGIVGPFFGWLAYKAVKGKVDLKIATFIAAAVADWATYVVTSFQLALAFPAGAGVEGVLSSATKFMAIFAVTQVPLAIIEGTVAALLIGYLASVKLLVKEEVTA
ncbi:cobalamin biosynthesis protein CbiM [Ferroglobus placidus DSM 10642]|uniref:Putative cobalt transport protein CbiM n=1 Tax=Ferroglobus placidus (strain DSM 10642 / AEDII12DO) TaxID=589924 RepID=D3RYD3_FERPA|nr:energy-coupling factor ABC transporter permease [Ferroglobus placidus]ADC65496.1 cobalamin biosynthesis protein CbiM [Ferroglobus placidus DSM 10642]